MAYTEGYQIVARGEKLYPATDGKFFFMEILEKMFSSFLFYFIFGTGLL